MAVQWHEGARECEEAAWEPVQVHAYEPATFILRQSPCAHFEANFVYLLVGSGQALLIDTGAIEEAEQNGLAETVFKLLRQPHGQPMPLLVVHTHGHRDHRAGDAGFAAYPQAAVVPAGDGMREFFNFRDWPSGSAEIDLGDRVVHVLPAPGHHPDHLVFYDERTALLFTGDFLLPGRLLVDDLAAYRASAARVMAFVSDKPVAHILGGHLELDARGQSYRRGATHRPDQGRLELAKDDLLALATALDGFNRFYARHPRFILSHPVNNLIALCALVLAALAFAIRGWTRFSRRRRAVRQVAGQR